MNNSSLPPSRLALQLVLEAVRGDSYTADIAVDDVTVTTGPCTVSYDCNFENGFCSWTQDGTDQFNWERLQGPTDSGNTGPDTDHTLDTGMQTLMLYCIIFTLITSGLATSRRRRAANFRLRLKVCDTPPAFGGRRGAWSHESYKPNCA